VRVHEADAVLVACGAATPSVVAPLGVEIPNGSPVSMLVHHQTGGPRPGPVLNTPRAAVRPNPGNTLALDHDWYEENITEHADGTFSIPDDVVQELADEASKLIAGNPELKPRAGRSATSPFRATASLSSVNWAKVPGCFVAFTHSGATLGLVAANCWPARS
jgi:glycine/D-amino acid oxidase-like deaminating enzyme